MFSDLVIVYLALYVSILGKKCDRVLALDENNLQKAFDGVNSLVARRAYQESTELASNDEINSDNLITVVGTADGLLHGFDQQNNKKWTADVGGGPLSSHHSSGNLDYSVIPSTDGSLLLHSVEGMRKTSVTARMLVEKAPFVTHDGLIFTSQKNSRVIGVDLGSGRVVHDLLGSGGIMGTGPDDMKRSNLQGRGATYDRERTVGGDGGGGSYRGGGGGGRKSHRSPFWLGRTDYTLRAFDQMTGAEEFNFTYSELRPLNKGAGAPSQDTRSSTNMRIGSVQGAKGEVVGNFKNAQNSQPLPLPLISTPDGELYFTDLNGQIHRTYSLDYPAVTAFTVEDDGDHTSVRTQSGYSVQPLRLAYRMPAAECYENANSDENDSDDDDGSEQDVFSVEKREKKRKRKCLPSSESMKGNSPQSASNIVIVRSLNDGGLYALEMSDGHQTHSSAVSAVSTRIAPEGSAKVVKGLTSSATLPLALPSPTTALPDADHLDGKDRQTNPVGGSDSDGSIISGAQGGNKNGPGQTASMDHTPDTSQLLKTFERLIKAQAKGQTGGLGSVLGTGGLGSGLGLSRMGTRAGIKNGVHSGVVEESGSEGVSGINAAAADKVDGGDALEGGEEGKEEGEKEVLKASSKLIGNHFVLQHRPGPVRKDLKHSDALVTHTKSSSQSNGHKHVMHRSLSMSDLRDQHRVRGQFDEDGRGSFWGDSNGDEEYDSFLDYLKEYRGSKVSNRLDVDGRDIDGDGGRDNWDGRAGLPTASSTSLPRPLHRSFFNIVIFYLHMVEMLMLRVLVFAFCLYVSLFWLKSWGVVLPSSLGYLSDSLLSAVVRLVVKPELLLMRTKSFMSMDSVSKSGDNESNGLAVIQASGLIVEEDDLELIEGGYTCRVGSLLLTADVLGYGSHGTVVLRGSLNGRPVAVKRMLARFNKAADREVSLLIRSDGHPNVVRYFLRETKNEFVYLALQLCSMSLRDFVAKLQKSKKRREKERDKEKDRRGVSALCDSSSLVCGRSMIPDEARSALRQVRHRCSS